MSRKVNSGKEFYALVGASIVLVFITYHVQYGEHKVEPIIETLFSWPAVIMLIIGSFASGSFIYINIVKPSGEIDGTLAVISNNLSVFGICLIVSGLNCIVLSAFEFHLVANVIIAAFVSVIGYGFAAFGWSEGVG